MNSTPWKPADRLFLAVFAALTLLAAAPFWMTRILPMQDYPHFLVLVRAFADLADPKSPFHGTYATGFPLSPIVLPMALTRAIGALVGLETAGRVMWTLYAVALPVASLHLLSVLGRDRWAVLLVFPLIPSYWAIGGFFAFATAAPLFVLALALSVRWLVSPSRARGIALALVLCAIHLWHALVLAQIVLDFMVLWLLVRTDDTRARLRALWPLAPALGLFAAWMASSVRGRSPGSKPPAWPPFFDNASRIFEYVGPTVPQATGAAMLLALILAAGSIARAKPAPETGPFRVASPFAWLALLAAISYLALPATCFGVEGIQNRQPWILALLFVFAWRLPARRAPRALLLAIVGAAGALALGHMVVRFRAFDRETAGASRLLDRVGPRQTLLAPIGKGSTASFPGKPLVALDLYASVRHGGLPNASFAGYDINFIRYANGRNPMPGIVGPYLRHSALTRFDWVLLQGPSAASAARSTRLRFEARDGDWALFAVCGSAARPRC